MFIHTDTPLKWQVNVIQGFLVWNPVYFIFKSNILHESYLQHSWTGSKSQWSCKAEIGARQVFSLELLQILQILWDVSFPSGGESFLTHLLPLGSSYPLLSTHRNSSSWSRTLPFLLPSPFVQPTSNHGLSTGKNIWKSTDLLFCHLHNTESF